MPSPLARLDGDSTRLARGSLTGNRAEHVEAEGRVRRPVGTRVHEGFPDRHAVGHDRRRDRVRPAPRDQQCHHGRPGDGPKFVLHAHQTLRAPPRWHRDDYQIWAVKAPSFWAGMNRRATLTLMFDAYAMTGYPVRVRSAYRCRAYPDEAQQATLSRTFGCVRVVWNRTLAARHARWHAERKGTTYAETDRALTLMKREPEMEFLNEVSAVPLQQALRHQQAAFSAFFEKRARYPRFKSRRGRQSATYTRVAFHMKDGALRLAKTDAPLRFVWTWPDADLASLDPTSITVTRDPAGRWFVTFHADVPDPGPLPAAGQNIGVDVGLKDFAVLSTGEKVPHPRDWERHEHRLKRYQRRLARCQRSSRNRAKAARKVARAHARITDARRDFLHKASTCLVRENRHGRRRGPERARDDEEPQAGPRDFLHRVG